MAMTEQEQKALRSYCAFLLKEYGFQFSPNDPVIPALYIIHREMQMNNQRNKVIADKVNDAASKLNLQSFHFNVPGEAWKYQVGIAVKWFLFSLILVMLISLCVWAWSLSDKVQQADEILNSSKQIRELLLRMKTDKDGYYFIDFKEASGNSVLNFSEYDKINQKTIRIYLGKDHD